MLAQKKTMPPPNATQSIPPETNGHMKRYIWLVTGPAGSGKSTVAKYLATALKFPYIEGDEVSPFLPPLLRLLTYSVSPSRKYRKDEERYRFDGW